MGAGAGIFGSRRCGVDRGGKFYPKCDEPMPQRAAQRGIRALGRVFLARCGAPERSGGFFQSDLEHRRTTNAFIYSTLQRKMWGVVFLKNAPFQPCKTVGEMGSKNP